MSFSEERTRLENRRDELDSEARKITELVEYLDTKKYETISYSFNRISTNFTEVFKKLGTCSKLRNIIYFIHVAWILIKG